MTRNENEPEGPRCPSGSFSYEEDSFIVCFRRGCLFFDLPSIIPEDSDDGCDKEIQIAPLRWGAVIDEQHDIKLIISFV